MNVERRASVLMSILGSWRVHRQWSRAKAEAKQLASDAKRLLRKKRYRIPEPVASLMTAAVVEVDVARKGRNLERLRNAIADIDDKMDEYLAFARKSSTRQYAESISLALGAALFLRAFVVEAFQIPSGSMIPTLAIGDHIFVSKFAYAISLPFSNEVIATLGKPKRGDIIVFKYPPDQNIDYIKRVLGLPGETLELRHNQVFIDGRPMPREESRESCVPNSEGGAAFWRWRNFVAARLYRQSWASPPLAATSFTSAPSKRARRRCGRAPLVGAFQPRPCSTIPSSSWEPTFQ